MCRLTAPSNSAFVNISLEFYTRSHCAKLDFLVICFFSALQTILYKYVMMWRGYSAVTETPLKEKKDSSSGTGAVLATF